MTLRAVDTSAWHHAADSGVAERWRAALEADEVAICDQVRLEILYSARSAREYDALAEELAALKQLPTTAQTFERALEVQRALAHVGGLHHRSVKIADLVIAATAEAAGVAVWHYDRDYERIADVTGQPVEWIAPPGSL
jgi:predicted nucleic acid-binding protein